MAYPHESLKALDDYDLPITNLVKVDYFSRLKIGYPENSEIERTDNIIEYFNIKTGKEVTEFYLKTDVILLADVFEKFIKVSLNEFKFNPLYCLNLPGYTWECSLKYTGIIRQTFKDKDMIYWRKILEVESHLLWDKGMLNQMKTKRFYLLMRIICMGE